MQLLIIGNEDLFVEALGRFPSSSYAIAYAAELAEAALQIESCQPRIIIAAGVTDDEPLHKLLQVAHQRHGALRIGVGVEENQLTTTFDHLIAETEHSKALDKIELLAYTLPTRAAEAPSKTLEEQVAQQARDLKSLGKRVAEIAVGTTSGLAELLVTMDGVQQALKLHMRLIEGIDHGEGESRTPDIAVSQVRKAQRELEERLSALSVQLAPFSTGDDKQGKPRDPNRITSQLEAQVEHQSHDLKSLEQRMSEVIAGTTGGLTELIEASDGVQQALKLHARLITDLETRIDNEVMPLRTSVVEMGNEVMGLRRDIRALQRRAAATLPGDLDEELESDLELMLEPLDEENPPPRPTPGKPAAK